jgi:hypothetical protein
MLCTKKGVGHRRLDRDSGGNAVEAPRTEEQEMTFRSLLIGAAALVAMPVLSASAATGSLQKQDRATSAAQSGDLIAEIECHTYNCPRGNSDRWRGKKGRRLQPKRDTPSSAGGGRRRPAVIPNRGGPGNCYRRPQGGYYCPGG